MVVPADALPHVPLHGQDFPLAIEGLAEEPCVLFAGRHGLPRIGGFAGPSFFGGVAGAHRHRPFGARMP